MKRLHTHHNFHLKQRNEIHYNIKKSRDQIFVPTKNHHLEIGGSFFVLRMAERKEIEHMNT